jgi:hypothetical protein
MSTKEDKRIRLQLDFTEDGLSRIEKLRSELNAKSNADVVRTAVRLLEWFIAHDKAGNKLFVVDPDNNTQRQVELIIG